MISKNTLTLKSQIINFFEFWLLFARAYLFSYFYKQNYYVLGLSFTFLLLWYMLHLLHLLQNGKYVIGFKK